VILTTIGAYRFFILIASRYDAYLVDPSAKRPEQTKLIPKLS
jgi:hypothetical protein